MSLNEPESLGDSRQNGGTSLVNAAATIDRQPRRGTPVRRGKIEDMHMRKREAKARQACMRDRQATRTPAVHGLRPGAHSNVAVASTSHGPVGGDEGGHPERPGNASRLALLIEAIPRAPPMIGNPEPSRR